MKSTIRPFFVLIVLAVNVLSSCSDDWEDPYLNIAETEYNVKSSSEQLVIPIETNTHWQILSSIPSWLGIEKTEGDNSSELIVDVAANNSFERSAEIVIAASTSIRTINLMQAASQSGALSVATGDYSLTGFLYSWVLTVDFTVSNPHLASEAGIVFGGRHYACETLGKNCFVQIDLRSGNQSGNTYQAYALRKSTGKYVYGSVKTIN